MAGRKQSGLGLTRSLLPWPLGLALGFVVIAGFLSPNPSPLGADAAPPFSGGALTTLDWAALLCSGLGSLLVFLASRQHKLALAAQPGVDALQALSGHEFATLLGDALRRRGYAVESIDVDGSDNGADLVLRKAGRTELVHYQQWRTRQIDAALVRQTWNLTLDHGADAAKIVGVGDFTPMAAAFAAGKPIELINGVRLLDLIREVQRKEA